MLSKLFFPPTIKVSLKHSCTPLRCRYFMDGPLENMKNSTGQIVTLIYLNYISCIDFVFCFGKNITPKKIISWKTVFFEKKNLNMAQFLYFLQETLKKNPLRLGVLLFRIGKSQKTYFFIFSTFFCCWNSKQKGIWFEKIITQPSLKYNPQFTKTKTTEISGGT